MVSIAKARGEGEARPGLLSPAQVAPAESPGMTPFHRPSPRLRLATLAVPLVVLLGWPPASTARQTGAAAPAEATLRLGDNGPSVEGLQRRLNARVVPPPALDVDGDFGEATRAAVLGFQRTNGLPTTGTADPATLQALGPAPSAAPPVPAPEVVNAGPFPRKPADPIEGPPFTTAAAWAIADGQTGAILWGSGEARPLEMASTTKMMTALVVLRLASAGPPGLDEKIRFSEQADRTPGSTSGVHAGETAPARELLYGLLLPSGNDAAAAFAEHYGPRLPPTDGADPQARFVAEMNRTAQALGLRETHFANPHGLPAPGHRSSARDLARLAHATLADPTLAAVVATPRRGVRLLGADGQARDVVWSNTNKLLDFEGYDGVKTGTTTAAGACLVASGHRGGDRLIVVVLGAPSSDARYVDARNLFRWAWTRRAR
jgi:D-alanyl-D-alanine carboxypeptidase (penicillin-binding protein 5/6)